MLGPDRLARHVPAAAEPIPLVDTAPADAAPRRGSR